MCESASRVQIPFSPPSITLINIMFKYSAPCLAILLCACQNVDLQSYHYMKENITNTQRERSFHTISKTIEEKNNKTFALYKKEGLSFNDAKELLLSSSKEIYAVNQDILGSYYKSKALDIAHFPKVSISGNVGKYNLQTMIDTREYKQQLKDSLADAQPNNNASDILNTVGVDTSAKVDQIIDQAIDDEIEIKKQEKFSKGSLKVLMPIFEGGKIMAAQKLAYGMTDEKVSKAIDVKNKLQKELIKRYFQVKLLEKVYILRRDVYTLVEKHHNQAQKMLDEGVISNLKFLEAKVALANAQFEKDKSASNLKIAKRALFNLFGVQEAEQMVLKDELFINDNFDTELTYFQEKAVEKNPVFAKIKAKKKMVEAQKMLAKGSFLPKINAYGFVGLKEKPNYVFGVNLNWQIIPAVSRLWMLKSADSNANQVLALEEDAFEKIKLLIEKNYLDLQDTIANFKSLEKQEVLANEFVRMREEGFKAGINTFLELNDALANLSKIQTLKAKSAFEYIEKLSDLLQNAGLIDDFKNYQQLGKTIL